MKVALINAETDVFEMRMIYGAHENLALAQLASWLEAHNHPVSLIDLRVDGLNELDCARHVVKSHIDIVGLSINYVTFPSALKIAREIKLMKRDVIIVFGGEHVTYQDSEIFKIYGDYVDFIVRGESEETFLELVSALENKKGTIGIAGVSSKKGGIFFKSPDRLPIDDLDTLPWANRAVAERALRSGKELEIGILTQRGCPFPCSFCNANRFLSNESKMTVRQRSPANVVGEMEKLAPLLYQNRTMLRFYDATFITKSNISRKWAIEFCDEIERRKVKVPFDAFIRADSFDFTREEDQALLARLKNAGLISTYIGLESGSDQTLQVYNKKVDVNESEAAQIYLKKVDMKGSTNGCMTFQQESTLKDIKQTVEFIYRLQLCTFWNCLSRAETLPGIRLKMDTTDRDTCWDIYNYVFSDPDVAKLYSIMSRINRTHGSVRIEDRLTRSLRDGFKIEKFYNEHNIDWDSTRNELETAIGEIQLLTKNFVVELINNIKTITEAEIAASTLRYIVKYNKLLDQLQSGFGWILDLQPMKMAA